MDTTNSLARLLHRLFQTKSQTSKNKKPAAPGRRTRTARAGRRKLSSRGRFPFLFIKSSNKTFSVQGQTGQRASMSHTPKQRTRVDQQVARGLLGTGKPCPGSHVQKDERSKRNKWSRKTSSVNVISAHAARAQLELKVGREAVISRSSNMCIERRKVVMSSLCNGCLLVLGPSRLS